MPIAPDIVPWLLGLLGLFVGSFLNVCIHRLPDHRSIVFPGSACPACGAPIRPWQNVPVLSWIALRGRCGACAAPISLRYPFVELLTAGLFVLAWARSEPGWELARAIVFLCAMVVLFFTDLDRRVLPDLVTLPGAAAGVAFAFLASQPGLFVSPGTWKGALLAAGWSAAAAIGAAGALWLIGWLWRFVRPGIESAMGLGDVKMLALVGAFLGGRLTLLTVFLGSLLGTLLFAGSKLLVLFLPESAGEDRPRGASRAIRRGLEAAGFLVGPRSAGLLDQIPFGSMLAIGGAVSLLWGAPLIDRYLEISLSLGSWLADRLGAGA